MCVWEEPGLAAINSAFDDIDMSTGSTILQGSKYTMRPYKSRLNNHSIIPVLL